MGMSTALFVCFGTTPRVFNGSLRIFSEPVSYCDGAVSVVRLSSVVCRPSSVVRRLLTFSGSYVCTQVSQKLFDGFQCGLV